MALAGWNSWLQPASGGEIFVFWEWIVGFTLSGKQSCLSRLWLFFFFFLLLHFQHPNDVLSYSCYGSILVFPAVQGSVVPRALCSADLWWCPSHVFHLVVFWSSKWLSSGEWSAFILVPWFITLIFFFIGSGVLIIFLNTQLIISQNIMTEPAASSCYWINRWTDAVSLILTWQGVI